LFTFLQEGRREEGRREEGRRGEVIYIIYKWEPF
jgi:hypothetical protein